MKSKICKNLCTVPLDSCDITDIRRVPPESSTYTTLMKPLKKSYLLIGLSKFAQTFAVRFLKSILHSPNLHKCLRKLLL